MARAEDVLDLIYDHPTDIAKDVGFDKLTDIHDGWIREMVFGEKDHTLQAHRNSYKTTCLGFAMALIALLMPSKRVEFFRKTDNDVAEVLRVVSSVLRSDTFQAISRTLYGTGLTLTKDTLGEVSTSLAQGVAGASQIVGMGINGSVTGKHADIIFTDDIVTVRDRISGAERRKTDLFYQELHNIVNRGGKIFNSGTPWHKDDTFRLMPKAERHDCYSTGLMTKEQIQEKRDSMTASLFAANFELKHIADEDAIFKEARYQGNPEKLYDGIAHVDASYGGADGTALTCLKCDHRGDYHAYVRLWQRPVDEVLDEIVALCRALRCGPIWCESNADKGYVARDIRAKGYPARLYAEHENKFVKITTHLKGIWGRLDILDCEAYPVDTEAVSQVLDYSEHAEHDDMPDSMASAARIYVNKPRAKGFTEGI